MTETYIAPLWGIKVTVDAVANGFIVSCVSHGNSEIASMGNCIEPTLDEALLTAIAYYNAYLPDGLKMVAPAPFPLDVRPDCPGCGGYHHVMEPCESDIPCSYHDIYCFQHDVHCTACELFHLPRLRAHIEEPENEG